MARSPLIPLRPKDFFSPLQQTEQACITWYVLSGCSKTEAYVTFARPDMLGTKAKAALDTYVRQFFSQKDAIDYLNAYEKTLNYFLHPEPVKAQPSGTMEERKAKAKTKLVEFAMTLANDIETAEDPESVLKIADKIGLLDQDEEVEEQPRRYLPVTCNMCEYRKFVEENCEEVPDGTDIEAK